MNNSSHSQPTPAQMDHSIHFGKFVIPRAVFSIGKKVIFLLILALAVFYLLPQLSSIEKSIKVLTTLKPWAILLAIMAQFLSYMGSGLTISECVKLTNHRISAFRGLLITMASASIGLVAGGMVGSSAATFRWVKAGGGDNEGSSLAASLPPLFVDIVLVIVSIFGLIFLLIIHDLTKKQVVSFILITLLLVAISIVFVLAVNHKEKTIAKINQFLSAIYKSIKKDFPVDKFTKNLMRLFSTGDYLIKGGWKGLMLGSTVNIFFDLLTIFFVFLASGEKISPIILIAGYGLPLLFGRMAFIFPGGVGIIESTMVALYTSLGINNSLATVVVLTYRVISFWFPTISGFFILPFLNRISDKNKAQLS